MKLVNLRTIRYSFVVNSIKRFQSSEVGMKVFTQKRNPLTGTTEWDMQDENYDFHQEIARSSFADMLHDTERNKKYQRALQLAIEKIHSTGRKANVLDIGTGTGLLAIMAARSGADSVVACEAFKPMAKCCLKILERNNVADKVIVIPKRSTDIKVGKDGDMKQKANILVTEVFDTELIGEGALATFDHAHKNLLEENCIVVPDSAVIYAQVAECPTMLKWHKLNDLVDEDHELVLRTPDAMKQCGGSGAVHDIQLSQLPRQSFRELSDPIAVLHYDWSGRTPLKMNTIEKQEFTVTDSGKAQVVFVWWELNMDPAGKILLSCAPWWAHPDADPACDRPQDSIPWRDHWMQAVYYLPRETFLQKHTNTTLVACQDEYSTWFYLGDRGPSPNHYRRPACECGVHIGLAKTHISYLNDGKRSKIFLAKLKEELTRESVVLDLHGGGFLGLAASKMGAKAVYILENINLNIGILNDYIEHNRLDNVRLVPQVPDKVLRQVTNVVCDVNFCSALLPWENLKMAFLLYKFKNKMRRSVSIFPEVCELWAMPVEFRDLHKIRVPLNTCEDIDMSVFDSLVENSRSISDEEIEAQPLWEYPTVCRGHPRKLLEVDMRDLEPVYACDDTFMVLDPEDSHKRPQPINGFAIWAVWKVGAKEISTGPIHWPLLGDRVEWDSHTRQAVKILRKTRLSASTDKWSYQLACDLERGLFNVLLGFDPEELQ